MAARNPSKTRGQKASDTQPYPRLSEVELDELSTIGPEQIARAKRRWHRDAPDEFKELLDATPDEETSG